MKINWQKIWTILYEDKSKWISSTRFSFIFTMLLSNIIVWGLFLILSFIQCKFISVPESVIALYCVSNGIVWTGKIRQKKQENSDG